MGIEEFRWQVTRAIPHLRRYARALTGDRHRADDLVQDCLERGLRKQHLWRPSGSVRAWLLRILYRQFVSDYRRGRRRGTEVSVEAAGALTQAPRQERHLECEEVADALERLPAEQRATVVLVALEDLPYDEAASVLGVPVGTVRSRLSRGRDALRSMLEGEGLAAPAEAPEEPAEGSPRLRRVK
jgi:RNA polymerase sigma-70 factor, ECF subfamily